MFKYFKKCKCFCDVVQLDINYKIDYYIQLYTNIYYNEQKRL